MVCFRSAFTAMMARRKAHSENSDSAVKATATVSSSPCSLTYDQKASSGTRSDNDAQRSV